MNCVINGIIDSLNLEINLNHNIRSQLNKVYFIKNYISFLFEKIRGLMGWFTGSSQKGKTFKSYSLPSTFAEIERQQQKDLRSNERNLDREIRNLTLQEQKLVNRIKDHLILQSILASRNKSFG
jgi:hypothetical protein